VRHTLSLFSRRSATALFLIVAFFVLNSIYSMQPLNNLVPTSSEEIYQADQFLERYQLLNFERSHGFTLTLALARALTGLDYPILSSILGISFASITIVLIYMSVRHMSSSEPLALFSALLYSVLEYTIRFSSSRVGGLALSTMALALVAYFYATDQKGSNLYLILLSSTLAVFMRLENIALIFAFALYLAIRYRQGAKIKWLHVALLLYVCLLAQTYALYNYQPFLNSPSQDYIVGVPGTMPRLMTFVSLLLENLGFVGSVLVLVGIYYSIRKGSIVVLSLATALTYALLQLYPFVQDKYLYNLLPVLVVLAGVGAYQLSRRWYVALIIFAIIALGANTSVFNKVELDEPYINSNIRMGQSLDGPDVVLFGYRDLLFNMRRFYPGSILANDVIEEFDEQPSIGQQRYLVHLTELGSDAAYIEDRLHIRVEFIKEDGIAHLYRIQ
jgi:hypothetical protein